MSSEAEGPGPTRVADDLVTEAPLRRLAATLDKERPDPVIDDTVPPLWHWLYFTPTDLQRELDVDGHPRRGTFLPEVALPRRMWAGGRLDFIAPMRIGQRVARHSQVAQVQHKTGRSGRMVFVTVNHEIRGAGQPLVREAHDIVYREAPLPGAAPPAGSPADRTADLERTVVPDAVMLFRYSALTFNGHRIHYDRAYCRDLEQYPGLVVHGPLIATLLMDLLHRGWPQAQVRRFEFKAVSPLFDGAPITLRARRDGDARIALWAADEAGRLAMRADADITFS